MQRGGSEEPEALKCWGTWGDTATQLGTRGAAALSQGKAPDDGDCRAEAEGIARFGVQGGRGRGRH